MKEYTARQTDRKRDSHRERQTVRRRDREIARNSQMEGQTDRKTDKELQMDKHTDGLKEKFPILLTLTFLSSFQGPLTDQSDLPAIIRLVYRGPAEA